MNTLTPNPVHSRDQEGALVCAEAHPNIALIKYWGKRDAGLNLPAVGSVSITLDTLVTTTRLSLQEQGGEDELVLNGCRATVKELEKLTLLADCFRELAGSDRSVAVTSDNNFPTAAGLASSASGYAALVTALDGAYHTRLSRERLSGLARLGSGSAARSLFGGFARMHVGQSADGEDAIASPLLDKEAWPLEVVIAIASESAKAVSSTVGMESTRSTSVFYQPWIESQSADITRALAAIQARDFTSLGAVAEYSCLKMHGLMLSAQPGLLYWNHATVACIHEVRAMRAEGIDVFFTIDAGPQLKAVCAPGTGDRVAARLGSVDGVSRVLRTGLGDGARSITSSNERAGTESPG